MTVSMVATEVTELYIDVNRAHTTANVAHTHTHTRLRSRAMHVIGSACGVMYACK